ncbi:MAG: AAA family ATPase [Acidobacteria bacterium]|nr:MAG: AAA family ATPase [Acidobacteriota bacterium]
MGDALEPTFITMASSDLHRMGDVLLEFEELVLARDGTAYHARACGGKAPDNTSHWHGWIEFAPVRSGPVVLTPRETTQPDRANTARWANSLTPVYLEGALVRALRWGLVRVEAAQHKQRTPAGFERVGGMADLKRQVRRIIEMAHVRQRDARRYGIVRNGILLYGPPGCGKTFFAEAIGEEFGLYFLRVPLESAISKYVGGAPDAIERLFHEARSKAPCLLFFDEFDAIARKRQDAPMLHEQQMVDALLQQLDAHRETPGLLVVAATNRFDDLDPAVVREGRFDYKVKVDNPDFDGRLAILRGLIRARPHSRRLHLTELAHDLDGLSAAQIRSVVDEAALAALEANRPIRAEHLRAAYRAHVLTSRYCGVRLGWDDLILPADAERKLRFVQQFIGNPLVIRQLGVTPPSGVLLAGPPGTGKTTIARVLASESEASFFSVNAADVFSKWLGESEQRVKELFARARARVPAIIFIDELDAITQHRADGDSAGERVRNAVVSMFLAEMDGLDSSTRVFVIGATNRPEMLDEAMLRPGRLAERVDIPLPDAAARKAMLELFSRKMRLAQSVDMGHLSAQTEGMSGALLKGMCTLAGRNAFVRTLDVRGIAPAVTEAGPVVTEEDFEQAFRELSSTPRRRPIGFSLATWRS